MKNIILMLLKLCISATIIYYVFSGMNIEKIWLELKSVNIFYLIAAGLVLPVSLFFMTLKWKVFLNKYHNVRISELMKTYWASDFINLFAVGTIGSEFYKMFSFRDKKKEVLLSSLVDRGYSFVWYGLFSGSLFLLFIYFGNSLPSLFFGLLLFTFAALFFSFIVVPAISTLISYIKVTHVHFILSESMRSVLELKKHALYSTLYLFSTLASFSLLFYAVGLPVMAFELLIFIPILAIGVSLPISFQGIGVREYLFLSFASMVGLNPEKILLVAITSFFLMLIYRLFGLMPFLLLNKEHSSS